MFELQILFGNVVAPLAIVLTGYLALSRIFHRRAVAFVLAACSGIAIWTALVIRTGFSWWPEDAWQRVPVAAMIVSAVAMLVGFIQLKAMRSKQTLDPNETSPATRGEPRRSASDLIYCIAIAMVTAVAAWLIYPRGEAWAELQNQQFQWWAVITLAASFGWWGIAGCQPVVASTVGLATIPLLIASAFLTSLSMMKVTEPLIAVATVLGLCSRIDLRLAGQRSLPIMFAPTLFAMSGFVAHACFQSYLNLPRTLYVLAMLSPAILALVARMAQRKSTPFAIKVTVGLALLLTFAIGSWAYIGGEVGSGEEW